MNYEKASIIPLAKACGVTKTGIVYYFPHKLDLFMAVANSTTLELQLLEMVIAVSCVCV